jgi:hypothetical protein
VEEIFFIDIQRVADFNDIFVFGLRMYQFCFSCVFCELFECNIIAFEGAVKGIIVNDIIGIM